MAESIALGLRLGTTAEHANFAGIEGEITINETEKRAVVHDGTTKGGFPMARLDETGYSLGKSSDGTKLQLKNKLGTVLSETDAPSGGVGGLHVGDDEPTDDSQIWIDTDESDDSIVTSVNGKTGDVTISTISGNAGSATKLQSARTISLSGDATGSVSFDGSKDVTLNVTVSGGTGGSGGTIENVLLSTGGVFNGTTTLLTSDDGDGSRTATGSQYLIEDGKALSIGTVPFSNLQNGDLVGSGLIVERDNVQLSNVTLGSSDSDGANSFVGAVGGEGASLGSIGAKDDFIGYSAVTATPNGVVMYTMDLSTGDMGYVTMDSKNGLLVNGGKPWLSPTGNRGLMAGSQYSQLVQTDVSINADSPDTVFVYGGSVTIENGSSDAVSTEGDTMYYDSWTKAIVILSANSLTVGTAWRWPNGEAPALQFPCLVIAHWNCMIGIVNIVPFSVLA